MTAILETKGIGIHFGGLRAVDNVSFTAEKGQITAIIGPNGAGKTTLFNLIAGFYTPTEGQVYFEGKDITGVKTFRRTDMGLTRTFQNINLFKDLGSRRVTVILNRIGLFINEKPPAFQNTGGIFHVSTGPCVFQFIFL